MTATAKPDAVAETEDNDVERRTPSGSASAWGIKTGTGDDRIVIGEQGILQVNALGQTATAMAGLSAVGIDAGAGSNQLDILGLAAVTASQGSGVALVAAGNVSALGIQAGAGDDRIAIGSHGEPERRRPGDGRRAARRKRHDVRHGDRCRRGEQPAGHPGRLEVAAMHAPVSLSTVGEGRQPWASSRARATTGHGRERRPADGPRHVNPPRASCS